MKDLCPTLQALLDLGFEQRSAQFGMETVGYRFPHLDLTASDGISKYFQPVVFLNGVLKTGYTLGIVESEIPRDLESSSAAAAWVSYALQSYERELAPLPDWMIEGKGHWDLIPFVREAREYDARPRCAIDRDYARILREKLRRLLSELSGDISAVFSFDGRVLSVLADRHLFEVIAEGNAWSTAYEVRMGAETKLPGRFMSPVVEVSFYGGYLHFGRSRYTGKEIET